MQLKGFIRRNSGTILAIMSCVGVVVSAALSANATSNFIKKTEKLDDPHEKAKVAVKEYAPTAIVTVSTIACICGANVLNHKTQASMVSAYALANESYKKYRAAAREVYGPDADEKITEAMVKAEPVSISAWNLDADCSMETDSPGDEKVLFYDAFSHRYFESTINRVILAEYNLNRNYILRGYATLNEFYKFLGIPPIDGGNDLEWAPYDEDQYWIDFIIYKSARDGREFYIIEFSFEPGSEEV